MKLIYVLTLIALLSTTVSAQEAPYDFIGNLIKFLEYNDYAVAFLYRGIHYGILVLGPAAITCALLPTIMGLITGIFPIPIGSTLSGQAQFDACMKGVFQSFDYWFFLGSEGNRTNDFSV